MPFIRFPRFFLKIVAVSFVTTALIAQHRPPAVPLIANDPFFSVWSTGDRLTDGPTRHWTGAPQPLTGLLRIDGKTVRWMGSSPRGHGIKPLEAIEQKSITITPLHSVYVFEGAGVQLTVDFFTPLLPHNLDVLSRPVTYLSWQLISIDKKPHSASILLDIDPAIAVDQPWQQVEWSRLRSGAMTFLNIGTQEQKVLGRSGDKVRIDWGHFHLGVPDQLRAKTLLSSTALTDFVKNGTLGGDDDMSMPRPAESSAGSAAHLAVEVPVSVYRQASSGHVLLGYTDQYSIEYLGQKLRPYWQRNGQSESSMLLEAEKDLPHLEELSRTFDTDLMHDMKEVGGDDYAYLGALLYRQTIAAHKLVADNLGKPMFFSKENASNGCIDTVDVTYPSAPFFLFFNPYLLEAQLEPVMHYASLPRWKFPFAPHDLGTYPLANGQVYGGGEVNEDDQMPVEESGNLLILTAALGKAEGNWSFAKKYMPQLTQWAAYLAEKGLDPENQLSTDDFSGHLAHNTNLSIKAIEALGAFVQIAHGVGDEALAQRYQQIVQPMPSRWEQMALDGDHYRLAFNQAGSWSQKYNLVWDDMLGIHLFPATVMQKEWAFYKTQMKPYGLPLDNRKTITKLDWELWTASLATSPDEFADLLHRTVTWADQTPSRVPTTDFYDAVSGRQEAFQARSVVGGTFIKILMNQQLADKWRKSEK
jgi:hypothetical protein